MAKGKRYRNLPLSFRIRLRLYLWYDRIRHFHTPLQVRSSVSWLRHCHQHPWLAFLRLFIPTTLTSWKFPLPPLVPSKQMLGNEELEADRRVGLNSCRAIPVWRSRDTPLRSLYRMYEAMASGNYVPIGFETEYFFFQNRSSWALHNIEDPKDFSDPIRYAIIACLVEELVVAFNWRLSLGLRRNRKHVDREDDDTPWPPYDPVSGPSWTSNVPPITPEQLHGLPDEYLGPKGELILEKGGVNEVFAKRNIITNVGWLYTI